MLYSGHLWERFWTIKIWLGWHEGQGMSKYGPELPPNLASEPSRGPEMNQTIRPHLGAFGGLRSQIWRFGLPGANFNHTHVLCSTHPPEGYLIVSLTKNCNMVSRWASLTLNHGVPPPCSVPTWKKANLTNRDSLREAIVSEKCSFF